MKQKNNKIQYDEELLKHFCIKHHIKKLGFFGSVIRSDFNSKSDIDIIVEFEDGHTPGFFSLYDMEVELSSIFENRKVDLRTKEDLSHFFRDDVVENMQVHYEA